MKIEEEIIDELNKFDPAQCDWKDLDVLIEKASEHSGEDIVKALLNLFERFPEHDGYGVFWSIIHTLETIGCYETELVNSIQRQPHEMSVLMLNRLLNDGDNEINGRKIVEILQDIAANNSFSHEIRKQAKNLIEDQQNRT